MLYTLQVGLLPGHVARDRVHPLPCRLAAVRQDHDPVVQDRGRSVTLQLIEPYKVEALVVDIAF